MMVNNWKSQSFLFYIIYLSAFISKYSPNSHNENGNGGSVFFLDWRILDSAVGQLYSMDACGFL